MTIESSAETQRSSSPGTLEKFHLGLAADGMTCALVFVDEHHRSIACIASFADLNGFILSLTRAAAEMARRRSMVVRDDAPDDDGVVDADPDDDRPAAFDIASSSFRVCPDDGRIAGTLIGDDGQAIPIRMRQDVANEMMRDMLRMAQASGAC